MPACVMPEYPKQNNGGRVVHTTSCVCVFLIVLRLHRSGTAVNCHNYIPKIQNQPGNSNLRTVIRSERITVRIHDELQSAVICELQSAFRGAARRPASPGTESPAVPVWDLLGPPAFNAHRQSALSSRAGLATVFRAPRRVGFGSFPLYVADSKPQRDLTWPGGLASRAGLGMN